MRLRRHMPAIRLGHPPRFWSGSRPRSRRQWRLTGAAVAAVVLASCTPRQHVYPQPLIDKITHPSPTPDDPTIPMLPIRRSATLLCRVSWYATGRWTASGARFNPTALTAASRTLPFGSRVTVTYNDQQVTVVINDRGPARWTHRCLDLSRGAFARIAPLRAGVITAEVDRV